MLFFWHYPIAVWDYTIQISIIQRACCFNTIENVIQKYAMPYHRWASSLPATATAYRFIFMKSSQYVILSLLYIYIYSNQRSLTQRKHIYMFIYGK